MKQVIKIFGFEISKKQIIIGGIVIAVIGIFLGISSYKQKQADLQRIKEQEKAIEEANKSQSQAQGGYVSYEDALQQSLVEEYGEPPEGFKWDIMGELVALSSDDMSAEDVIHTYIRSISIMDFATAQRYAATSRVYDTYNNYYDEMTNVVTDYYQQFLRKQYTFAIKSIENLGIESNATMADGTQVVSVKLNILDLTDKDFWKDDMKEIYRQMRLFGESEDDDTKRDQYLYDYIYSKYEDGTIKKREVVCDFKIGKQKNGGWLIVDDSELNAYLSYDKGNDVAQYIIASYNDWLLETTMEEQKAFLEQQQEEIKRQTEQATKVN